MGRNFRVNSIFAKISTRENISDSLFAKFSSRENKVLYSISSARRREQTRMAEQAKCHASSLQCSQLCKCSGASSSPSHHPLHTQFTPSPSNLNRSLTSNHRRTGRGSGGGQFVDTNSGRESRLFGQNTIHV